MAMHTLADQTRCVTGGVDTHRDTNVAAVVDSAGRVLATAEFTTDLRGHKRLMKWMCSFGSIDKVGIEGTGTYGSGLARFLHEHDIKIVEVDRPNRQMRRHRGKTDFVDAEAAARAALNGEASGVPKSRTGSVEMLRALRVARRSAVADRTRAANQLHGLVISSPSELREELRTLRLGVLVDRAIGFRPGELTSPVAAFKFAMKEIAQRFKNLDEQVNRLDCEIKKLVQVAAPQLLELKGVGPEVATHLLVAAGDNPERFKNEASFARLCAVAPIQASSGMTQRHRLDRGGDRLANYALWRIVLVRMATDPETRSYVERRTREGKSKREIIRCLKRYVVREVFQRLPAGP
jgi:transposase